MTPERKSHRLNARVPAGLVARMDFVIRNTDTIAESRSAALLAALEVWLSIEENKLRELGILAKKARYEDQFGVPLPKEARRKTP